MRPRSGARLTTTATETHEPTPTPSLPRATPLAEAVQTANCRFGPGTIYDVVGCQLEGQSAPIVGRNAENTWWAITIPERPQPCWVSGGTLQASGDLGPAQILAARPRQAGGLLGVECQPAAELVRCALSTERPARRRLRTLSA